MQSYSYIGQDRTLKGLVVEGRYVEECFEVNLVAGWQLSPRSEWEPVLNVKVEPEEEAELDRSLKDWKPKYVMNPGYLPKFKRKYGEIREHE